MGPWSSRWVQVGNRERFLHDSLSPIPGLFSRIPRVRGQTSYLWFLRLLLGWVGVSELGGWGGASGRVFLFTCRSKVRLLVSFFPRKGLNCANAACSWG